MIVDLNQEEIEFLKRTCRRSILLLDKLGDALNYDPEQLNSEMTKVTVLLNKLEKAEND